MAKTYEVQFNYTEHLTPGVYSVLYTGNKRQYNAYVKQAIQKGQEPDRLKIVEVRNAKN